MADRARNWRRLVEAWGRSGLSQSEFCRRRGVKIGAFGWWKRRLKGVTRRPRRVRRPDRGSRVGGGNFVEVAMPGNGSWSAAGWARGPWGYEMALPRGWVIRLPHDFDLERARQLVTLAESC